MFILLITRDELSRVVDQFSYLEDKESIMFISGFHRLMSCRYMSWLSVRHARWIVAFRWCILEVNYPFIHLLYAQ